MFLFLFVEGKYLFWTNVGQNGQMPFSGKKNNILLHFPN